MDDSILEIPYDTFLGDHLPMVGAVVRLDIRIPVSVYIFYFCFPS
jgi:hypothetical protein